MQGQSKGGAAAIVRFGPHLAAVGFHDRPADREPHAHTGFPGHTTPLSLSAILNALRGLDDDDPPPRGGAAKRMTAGNIDADNHAAIDPVAYRLARLRREADLRAASIRAHRDNIRRYKRILETDLTDLERQFVVRRLAEERSAIRNLAQGRASGGADADFSIAASC